MSAKRILIIDDEADIRLVAQVSLQRVGGWDVITAACGREGIALAQAEQPDAILLDVMMPDMDGPTVVQHLQAATTTRHIPVILLTAKTQTAEKARFSALHGVRGVLSKPFDPLSLPSDVAAALSR